MIFLKENEKLENLFFSFSKKKRKIKKNTLILFIFRYVFEIYIINDVRVFQ